MIEVVDEQQIDEDRRIVDDQEYPEEVVATRETKSELRMDWDHIVDIIVDVEEELNGSKEDNNNKKDCRNDQNDDVDIVGQNIIWIDEGEDEQPFEQYV